MGLPVLADTFNQAVPEHFVFVFEDPKTQLSLFRGSSRVSRAGWFFLFSRVDCFLSGLVMLIVFLLTSRHT
jgi:hypothetical protein